MELEFGVGQRPIDDRVVDCVKVFWPRSGLRQTLLEVAVDHLLVVREASDKLLVTRVIPGSGTTDGGDDVEIRGFKFAPGAQVTFNGVPATNVEVKDENTITCTTPANAEGAADVEVTVGTEADTLEGGFRYISPDAEITVLLRKDVGRDAVVLSWNDIGQERYRVHRALGPKPAEFEAETAFHTTVAAAEFADSGALTDGVDYYYLVPGGECGNGKVDPAEDCDGTDLGGETCESLGFGSGTLSCTSICTFDVSGCVS